MTDDSDQSILLGVTASIAAYKACDLVRLLQKAGHDVRVLMSENAERLIGRGTFEALSGHSVYSSEWEEGMVHIDAKNAALVYAIVPATANTIAKMAHGIADNIICSTYLAARCPVLVAPAMNPGMYCHPALQRNLRQLQGDGVEILEPDEGAVLCGDEGQGKLADIERIRDAILALAAPEPSKK